MPIPAETFFIDPKAEGTLQARIQRMVAEGILSGRFHPGEKLPSTRRLARHLGVSRITVTLAFTELLADDYLTSRGRSGYYVSANAPQPSRFTPVRQTETVDWDKSLARRFTGGTVLKKPADWRRFRYPFIYGQVDETLFDHANWRLCAVQALGQREFEAMTQDYFDADDPKLVEFICRHTLPRRGIAAEADQVLITLGAQNALWLTSQLLLTRGRRAAFEDPCYPALRSILEQTGCDMAPVSVDQDGLPPDAIPPATDVVFTTPSHQCPTNATMPVDRRKALLDLASERDLLIVEDDYEFEMAFLSPPSPALKSLDREGRVIYVGSFSKSLFPGLRLGYLVGSSDFISEARALRASVLRHPPGHIQRTAAYFLSLGHYDALIRRMARAFAERRRVTEAALRTHGLPVGGRGTFGGSSFWMAAPEMVDTRQLAERLAAQSVLIEPGAPFFAGDHAPVNRFRLAYSSIPNERIGPGVALIAEAIRAG